METEIWKDVVGYEELYQVSSLGRLRTLNPRKYCMVMSDNCDNGAGYMVNGLRVEGKKDGKTEYRHRLVATAFIPNPDNLPQVGHRDDDKSNNAVSNLYWCDGRTNILDAHKTGRMKKRSNLGSINSYDEEVIAMAYRAVKTGYFGVSESARFFGMPRTTLSSIMNKRARGPITDLIDLELDPNKKP